MNIFVTDDDPFFAASALDDKRVNKMITESAQMLSTAIFVRNEPVWLSFHDSSVELPTRPLYKPTHKNHPCNVWARETRENYVWLLTHGKALAELYTKVYDREHASEQILGYLSFDACIDSIPPGPLTPFSNSARNDKLGLDFTHIKDVNEAYRSYLKARWAMDKRIPTWQKRGLPVWMIHPEV